MFSKNKPTCTRAEIQAALGLTRWTAITWMKTFGLEPIFASRGKKIYSTASFLAACEKAGITL